MANWITRRRLFTRHLLRAYDVNDHECRPDLFYQHGFGNCTALSRLGHHLYSIARSPSASFSLRATGIMLSVPVTASTSFTKAFGLSRMNRPPRRISVLLAATSIRIPYDVRNVM